MQLSQLLSPERIRIPLLSTSKEEILEELVGLAAQTAKVGDVEEVLRSVRAREEVLSTGIGNGIAIPHGKSAGIAELALVAGVHPTGIDFEALDGERVSLFFLLIGPEAATGQHVKALSRISRLLRRESFRVRLLEATTADAFHSVIVEAEST